MGQRYLIQGGNKTRMSQIPIEKYSMPGDTQPITPDLVKKIGDLLEVDWAKISLDQLVEGTNEENTEHPDVVGNNLEVAVRIALAHLKEVPDYYDKIKAIEGTEKMSKVWGPEAWAASAEARRKGLEAAGGRKGGISSEYIFRGLERARKGAIARGYNKIKNVDAAKKEAGKIGIPNKAINGILHMKGNGYTHNDIISHLNDNLNTKQWASRIKDKSPIKGFLDRHFK